MFTPKFHCEINPTERVWCHAKRYTRAHCGHTFQDIKQTIGYSQTLDLALMLN